MNQLTCQRCGNEVPERAEQCPHCNANLLFQVQSNTPSSRRYRFRVAFVLVAVACIIMALWLPR